MNKLQKNGTTNHTQSSNNSNKQNDYDYDLIHNVTNKIRTETSSLYQPAKNTLSYLVYQNKPKEILKKLTSPKFDPDERDTIGQSCSWTPLYWSVKLGHIECTKVLLEAGANINIVINDFEECCGTVLDLAMLRNDDDTELLLRQFAEKEDISLGQSFKAIRSKLRGKAPSFNFRYYGKKKQEDSI